MAVPKRAGLVTEAKAQKVGRDWMRAMRRGDLEAAWCQTDRLEIPRREGERAGAAPAAWNLLWDGTTFTGRRVVIHCNHGLGDTIQFVRFVPQVVRVARSVTVMVQPPLVSLLKRAGHFGNIRNGWATRPPARDVAVEVMELPYALRLRQDELAPTVPYLGRCTVDLAKPSEGRPRIGLVWAASGWDHSRSIPPEAFEPLRPLSRVVDFCSLQYGASEGGPAALPFPMRCGAQPRSVLTTANALRQVDLLITVDTMTAHLAGAMGLPVWLLLKHTADWRWMRGSRSPWYPTIRIFRQRRPGTWADVVKRITRELSSLGQRQASFNEELPLQLPSESGPTRRGRRA
jgi:hypothetical protein